MAQKYKWQKATEVAQGTILIPETRSYYFSRDLCFKTNTELVLFEDACDWI